MSAITVPGSGGNTKGRHALTGAQLEIVLRAAHCALAASGLEITPSKVNRIVRRFSKTLARARLTFHEFLTNEANRTRIALLDPELRYVLPYFDPIGEKAVNHVMHERGY